MNKFKDLLVWQKAVDLATEIYDITAKFPSEERFGLVSQINRCTVSIASNIAEGAGRNSNNEFVHFIGIAVGSAFELETQIIIAGNLKLVNAEALSILTNKLNDIQNMLFGLQKALKSKK